MPIGNEVATSQAKATTITKSVDSAGNHVFALNLEGTVSGGWEGTTLTTMTVTSRDLKTGTYTATMAAYLSGGGTVTGSAHGVIGAVGEHKWQLNGVGLLEDGTRVAFEGVMELATRSLDGKAYAIS